MTPSARVAAGVERTGQHARTDRGSAQAPAEARAPLSDRSGSSLASVSMAASGSVDWPIYEPERSPSTSGTSVMALDADTRRAAAGGRVRRSDRERLRARSRPRWRRIDGHPRGGAGRDVGAGPRGLVHLERLRRGLDLSMRRTRPGRHGRPAYASPAFRSAFGTNVGIGSQGLGAGSRGEAQKAGGCPASRPARSSPPSPSTEPEAGSGQRLGAHHRLRRDGEACALDGTRRNITNARTRRTCLRSWPRRPIRPSKGGGGPWPSWSRAISLAFPGRRGRQEDGPAGGATSATSTRSCASRAESPPRRAEGRAFKPRPCRRWTAGRSSTSPQERGVPLNGLDRRDAVAYRRRAQQPGRRHRLRPAHHPGA